MNFANDKWHAVSVTVPPECIEAVEFAFGGMGSLGTETDLMPATPGAACTVTAYFLHPPADEQIAEEMRAALRIYGLPPDLDLAIRRTVVERQDWLAEWKKHWHPTRAGRFVIAAPWHEPDDRDAVIIRIEPNMAFGTGTHETTRLCLEAIDRHFKPGQSFLDVGTGTGILAIAAAKLGSDRVDAIDNDAEAVAIARENAELNGVGSGMRIETGTLEDVNGTFDLVCANLTADVIAPILPELIARTRSTLYLSGILAEQERSITDLFRPGTNYEIDRAGEWIGIRVAVTPDEPAEST